MTVPDKRPIDPDVPGLKSLRKLFALALSTQKHNSAAKAAGELRRAKSATAKRRIVEEHFAAWRETSGSEIRKFFRQYVDLGMAYPSLVSPDIVKWAEQKAWLPLCGQCGVKKFGESHGHRSRSVTWWLAVSIDKNYEVNFPDQKPWCAPKWLAANLSETDRLIEDWSFRLSARFAGVLDEEMESARVTLAIKQAEKSVETNPKQAKPVSQGSEQVPLSASGREDLVHTDDYLEVQYKAQQYKLTPLAASIVRLLHESELKGHSGLTALEIRNQTRCGRICDAFRKRDGKAFWKNLVKGCEQNYYSLHLD